MIIHPCRLSSFSVSCCHAKKTKLKCTKGIHSHVLLFVFMHDLNKDEKVCNEHWILKDISFLHVLPNKKMYWTLLLVVLFRRNSFQYSKWNLETIFVLIPYQRCYLAVGVVCALCLFIAMCNIVHFNKNLYCSKKHVCMYVIYVIYNELYRTTSLHYLKI